MAVNLGNLSVRELLIVPNLSLYVQIVRALFILFPSDGPSKCIEAPIFHFCNVFPIYSQQNKNFDGERKQRNFDIL